MQEIGFRAWRSAEEPVPAEARGRWCSIAASGLDPDVLRTAAARITFYDASGIGAGGRLHLQAGKGQGVCFVPPGAAHAVLEVMGARRAPGRTRIAYRTIGTMGAATRLLAAHPGLVRDVPRWIGPALLGLRPAAVKAGLRAVLGRAVAAETPVETYALWSALFNTWSPADVPVADRSPSLGFLVFDHGGVAGPDALAATVAGLERQYGPPQPRVVADRGGPSGVGGALARLPGCDYVGVLQAGEVLAPHASLLAAGALRDLGLPVVAYADEDACSAADGRPATPLFKPEPSRAYMVSGMLSRGLWLMRREVLATYAPELPADAGPWADTVRLDLWLRLHEAGETRAGRARRIPFVLTHRRPDAGAAPPEALARVVSAHLRRSALPFAAEADWPLRVRASPIPRPGRVTAIVPSTLRTAEAERSIKAVLAGTRYPDFELVVAVSQAAPLDASQRAAAARIEADARARVMPLLAERFNYSWVNNRAAAATAGDHVLLLNDDVSPIDPGWLNAMVAHLADPAVAVVGAKLLYPGGTVQHGGVLMGLSGLCDHANRHLAGHAPGYAGRAVAAQELSAVTGACLLVRRRVLLQVGGLDERYPSAFNDVDLCLRVREAGHAVVFAPEAVLHHHELRTYGSHYAGERAPFREAEAGRIRRRWAGVIADDPFHNPNLDLTAGREWSPAFPPRSPFGRVAPSVETALPDLQPAGRASRT